ncbi:MAG TPA: SpoIIE family protein phosphatase [Bryobacteraceae bacterium]|nr:SpoIIE family protein phosphatase [Bryobacteraceae bacterium]
MPVSSPLKSFYRKLRWPEKSFLALLVLYLILRFASPAGSLILLVQLGLTASGLVAAVRLVRIWMRKTIWRLRNRLIVAYLFIAVVPVAVILVLVGIGAYLLTGQMALYLVITELERHSSSLVGPTIGLIATPAPEREDRIRWMAPYLAKRFPGLEVLIREGGSVWRYPEESKLESPPHGWGEKSGFLSRGGTFYLWAHSESRAIQGTLLTRLDRDFLDGLVPSLGHVRLISRSVLEGTRRASTRSEKANVGEAPPAASGVPPAVNRFDIEVSWFAWVPVAMWESPGNTTIAALDVQTRVSAVVRTIFSQRLGSGQDDLNTAFLIVAILFLVVELVSLIIGVSMTGKITEAVHNLYEGTQRVMHGDFSHRIDVRGSDQLADLSHSFNRMTENLERLVRVEKEKERLQSELEIAREVQNQLYPRTVPSMPGIELTALCHPARTVSGDYYDYLPLLESKVALAIGDVAGKGISAALLMATLQSSLRTQIRACLEATAAAAAAPGGGNGHAEIPTSMLVSQLNQQLYSFTSAEKFATFYFGIYDDRKGELTYTNAGHPPPIVIRDGEVHRLETNGMVVGAFPFAEYGESRIQLWSGDLLVCFTDGITEPENEYGEMFGEQGLIDVLLKNVWRSSADIITSVIAAVHEWTNSPELQDDMTLLLAKRK